MDFTLTDEQAQIQDVAESFVADNELIAFARRAHAGEAVLEEAWDALRPLDAPAMTVPVEHGGLGEGMVYLTILLEALGRAAVPGPLPETAAVAAPAIATHGTEAQQEALLPAIADGEERWSVALYESGHDSLPRDIAAEASYEDGRLTLGAPKRLVPYGDAAERLVVVARTGGGETYDGLEAYIVDPTAGGVETAPAESLDPTRPVATVSVEDAPAEPLGGPEAGGELVRAALDRLGLAYAAMQVGAADGAVEASAEHGRNREQYGHPVGMYQAVKHRIADMWMDVQAARSLCYYAAWAVDEGTDDAPRAVSAATAYCGDVMPGVFGDDVQNHGAMGFTTDHDAHLLLKQATVWRQYLGDPASHYARIAEERGI